LTTPLYDSEGSASGHRFDHLTASLASFLA
jgi:hypothetical protein